MGFVPRKGTVDVIFSVKQMTEKYEVVRKKLYIDFVDLEKVLTMSHEE